jgi:hypothetical protein
LHLHTHVNSICTIFTLVFTLREDFNIRIWSWFPTDSTSYQNFPLYFALLFLSNFNIDEARYSCNSNWELECVKQIWSGTNWFSSCIYQLRGSEWGQCAFCLGLQISSASGSIN